ncbi:hypothetical protein ACQKC5_01970 [Shewanella baltica]|jgi:hypothetical protein|uniref:hypothetical protein n=1 Tax=Shewanella baltica TaxID=62322 RepID=UPI003CFEA83B
MKFLYEWITDTKKTIEVLGVTLLAVYLTPLILTFFEVSLNGTFLLVTMVLTILLPFGMLVTIVTNNSLYKSAISTTWSKAIISIALVAYTAMSNVWATSVINEIYGVSAGNFGITQTFLTLMFFVVTIMKWLFNGLFIVVIVGGGLLFWFFTSFGGSLKSTAVKITYLVVGVLTISATYAMVNNIDNSVDIFAKRVAAWGDFYPYNRCKEKDEYGPNGGVIFVSPGKVLVLKEKLDSEGKVVQYYPVKDCTI